MLSLELAIVVVLIVINGLLSMSELAVVSSRPARLSLGFSRGESLNVYTHPHRIVPAT